MAMGFRIKPTTKQYKQDHGEKIVSQLIYTHLEPDSYLIDNVTLKVSSELTTQIDHILFMPSGIYVIETKAYSGLIFGDKDIKKWQQKFYKKCILFQNPLHQNYLHIKTVEHLLQLKPSEHLHSLVVFCGDGELRKGRLKETNQTVISIDELHNFIDSEREKPRTIGQNRMQYYIGKVFFNRLPETIETDELHLNNLNRRKKLRLVKSD
ncbi:hypothetical protein VA249_45510 (plasmid) [Vibrio alfacsensis]|nr:hypothetical protein VA249_45510 [Vibrio alfacsensis]